MHEPVEFLFSFRSPYAWVAARHVLPMVDPQVDVLWRPFYPLPSFRNFDQRIPGRVRYNIADLLRLTAAYGLEIGRPPIEDPDWSIPHAAFVHAEREGRGPEFGMALLEQRWGKGEDVASEPIMARTAEAVGLEAEPLLAASRDEALRRELSAQIERNYEEHGLFGVPMFVLAQGDRFWGHDRMEWAIRYGFVPGRSDPSAARQHPLPST